MSRKCNNTHAHSRWLMHKSAFWQYPLFLKDQTNYEKYQDYVNVQEEVVHRRSCSIITLVNVYVDLVVFTRIAGTS